MTDNSCYRKHMLLAGIIVGVVVAIIGGMWAHVGAQASAQEVRLREVENSAGRTQEILKSMAQSLERIEKGLKE